MKSLLTSCAVCFAALTRAQSVTLDPPTNLTSTSTLLNTTAKPYDHLDKWIAPVTTADDDLLDKLREWGYNDNSDALAKTADAECNFDSPSGHMLKTAFTDLGIGLTSKNKGGPNTCFQIEHHSSPAVKLPSDGKMPEKASQRYQVCGTEYRITNAEHTVGINADAGAIYAMQLSSAAKAARRLWNRAPLAEELPHIRSLSDIAWAFWNRAHSSPESLQNINYLFVTMVINTETNRHVRRALSSLDPPREEADGWPGHDFSMETEAGKALLTEYAHFLNQNS